jgi:hypothetical protein
VRCHAADFSAMFTTKGCRRYSVKTISRPRNHISVSEFMDQDVKGRVVAHQSATEA